MSNLIDFSNVVKIHGEKVTTTSLEVARIFEKEHFHVMRDLRTQISKLPESFNASNFGGIDYVDAKGERREAMSLTRDGFMMIAMSYTTEKAMKLKVAYIEAFNKMEETLRNARMPTPLSPIEQAEFNLNGWKREQQLRLVAEAEREEAVRTKAQISDSKTATAMVNSRWAKHQLKLAEAKVLDLTDKLGEGPNWKTASIWRREIPELAARFASDGALGQKLARLCKELKLEVRKIEHPKYGQVNVYSRVAIDKIREEGES